MRSLVFASFATTTFALDNGLGLTPAMGWNSWNHYGCNINEDVIKDTAKALVTSGLADMGYNYVNIDDCWMAADRDAEGRLQANNETFPSGMKAVGDYIHSLGLNYGIYSSAGYKTCQGLPASLGNEEIDAQTFADWGVDYLKLDNCNTDGSKPELRYPVMRDALNATGRPIYYSLCEWGVDSPWEWASTVGNSWRTTGDIRNSWGSMLEITDANKKLSQWGGVGGWNDPDMLEVGNGVLSEDENKAHFSLWSIMKAPLIIGCDVTALASAAASASASAASTLSVLSAEEVIAVNQDPLGVQGRVVDSGADWETYAVGLHDGATAAVLFNRGTSEQTLTASWSALGLDASTPAAVRDLWAGEDVGVHTGAYTASVPAHGVVMVKVAAQQ